MNAYLEERDEQGFTLIELLIAIVVVGVLTAVAIVGVASLTDQGEKAACEASVDAAKAAQAVYYANNDGEWPYDLDALVTDGALEESGGVNVDFLTLSGDNWSVTATGGQDSGNPLAFAADACENAASPTTVAP
jgi:prepilin-type N-terminal cleavage/methylation domain-containing protein